MFSAVRISYGVGWKVSLIAELFGTKTGLGYLLNFAHYNFDTPLLFGTICAIVILTYVTDKWGFEQIERLLLPHRGHVRGGLGHVAV
jgi:ABC-type nitrate/sulfonate/bicarbonate transport system permease component